MYRVGVDIGGTTMKCGIFDEKTNLISKKQMTTVKGTWQELVDELSDFVLSMLHDELIPLVDVQGIGVGVPGIVDRNGIIKSAANLPDGEMDMKGHLQNYFHHMRIEVANDANTASLGEMKALGSTYQNIVLLTIGTGIGSGVIIDGHMVSGRTGSAGEIGHMIVNPQEEKVCGCGRRGCLEQYVSATGISRLVKERLQRDMTAREVFHEAFQQDVGCGAIINEVTDLLGQALSNVAVTLDPDCIIIGGGVSQAGEDWLQMIQGAYEEYALSSLKNTEIRLASLGNDAGIFGAAAMVE